MEGQEEVQQLVFACVLSRIILLQIYETADVDEAPEDRSTMQVMSLSAKCRETDLCCSQMRSGSSQDINETSIQPEQAFEIFMGKRYDTRSLGRLAGFALSVTNVFAAC